MSKHGERDGRKAPSGAVMVDGDKKRCALKIRNSEEIRSLDLHPQIESLADRLETQEAGNNSSWVSSEGR
eukprot:scaffold37562_cov22-Cyclotella_meneghiniana.AAC.2